MTDAKQATPAAALEQQICSAVEPKNEREWWAHREIERLRDRLSVETLALVETLARAEKAEAERDKNKGCCVELREIAESIQDPRLHNTMTIAECVKELQAQLAAERARGDAAVAEAAEAWRQVHLLKAETSGPDGFATWKDAATDERVRRVKAEQEAAKLRADAERWRAVSAMMTHEHRGDAVGWTLSVILPGDDPDAAIDATLTQEDHND